MALRKEGQPALRRAGHALAQELSRAYGDLGLDHVVGAPERVAQRIQEDENPVPLIVLQREPRQGSRRESHEDESSQDPQPHPGRDEQGDQHGEQQQRGAEVGLLDDEHGRHQGQRGRRQQYGLADRLRPPRRQEPHHHQHEAELEELGGLHRDGADQQPAPGARHRAPQQEDGHQHAEAGQVEQRRDAHQPAIVDAGHDQQRDEAEPEPEDLAERDTTAGPAHVEGGQRGGAERDEGEGGAQQGPVHVLEQTTIDPYHIEGEP